VGVKIMTLLLQNCKNSEAAAAADVPPRAPDIGPILCVCFTNHALDQFLEALLDTGCVGATAGDLVRVGARSKSERLEAHNLVALARAPGMRSGVQGKVLYEAMRDVRACDEALEPLLTAAVGGADALSWRDLDDFMCIAFNAAWNAFHEELHCADGFRSAQKGDVLQRWMRQRDVPAEPDAAAAGAAAGGGAAAQANRFAQLQLDDAAEAAAGQTKPKPKAIPKPRAPAAAQAAPPAAAAAPPAAPLAAAAAPSTAVAETVSAERLVELLDIARNGRCTCFPEPCECEAGPEFSLWSFSAAERRALALAWHAQLRAAKLDDLAQEAGRYEEAQARLDEAHAEGKLSVLRRARVVGMTTTGVASNQRLVTALGPRVVIVEEAAEVMEAHVLASLSPRTQQLILIGDHKQLRPKTQVYTLSVDSGRGYNLDVSLFERWAGTVPCPVPLVTLSEQWRMHPDIAELVRRTIYPQLRDAPAVQSRPPVRGMQDRLFFVDHDHPEAGEEEEAGAPSGSKQNAGEAEFVVALTKHLLHQGYAPGQIAVLTPYVGQLKRLRRMLSAVTMVFVDDADVADLQKEADKGGSDDDDDASGEGSDAGDDADGAAGPAPLATAALSAKVRLATIDNFQVRRLALSAGSSPVADARPTRCPPPAGRGGASHHHQPRAQQHARQHRLPVHAQPRQRPAQPRQARDVHLRQRAHISSLP
jgi:hypothetical protein